MPIFRAGNSAINIPEGSSYITIASPHAAEWRVCGLCKGGESVIGKKYKIWCANGQLMAARVTEEARVTEDE